VHCITLNKGLSLSTLRSDFEAGAQRELSCFDLLFEKLVPISYVLVSNLT